MQLSKDNYIFQVCRTTERILTACDVRKLLEYWVSFNRLKACLDENNTDFENLSNYLWSFIYSRNEKERNEKEFWCRSFLNNIKNEHFSNETLNLIEEAQEQIPTMNSIDDIKYHYGEVIKKICTWQVVFVDGSTTKHVCFNDK